MFKNKKVRVPIIVFIFFILLIVANIFRIFGEDPVVEEYKTFEELQLHVEQIEEINSIELIVEPSIYIFEIYQNTDKYNSVNGSIHYYLMSPDISERADGKEVIIRYFYEEELIEEQKGTYREGKSLSLVVTKL